MSIRYFSMVGSYEGGIFLKGHWVRVADLNRVDKAGWIRHQGPLTSAMAKIFTTQKPLRADELYPSLIRFKKKED